MHPTHHPGRAALAFTTLEGRLVPSANPALPDPPPAVVADAAPQFVGRNDAGEALYTFSAPSGRCNCAACRGLPPAEPAASAPVSPPATLTPAPVAAVAPARMFGSDLTATPVPAATPVVVARSDSGFALLAPPDVTAEAQPDVVSTPAPAAAVASVAPSFAGTGWRWGFADPFADPVGFAGAV